MSQPRRVTQTTRLNRIKALSVDLSRELIRIHQGSRATRIMADAITREVDAALAGLKTKD
jgi:hypothetical protein